MVCEQRTTDLPQAIAGAVALADIVELRLDCLVDTAPGRLAQICDELLAGVSKPVIVTLRSANEGGRQFIDCHQRIEFWRATARSLMSFKEVLVDIEAELIGELISDEEFSRAIDWQRVICSFHDFAGMPANLAEVYERMAAMPARILKIAVAADDITGCISLFHLLERARREDREMIALAMGQAGIVTRILGPSRGAFLTYGAVDRESATASGQFTVRELCEVYRIHGINLQTQIFGLMGRPVAHSISPHFQNAAFAAAGMNGVYVPFEVSDAGAFLERMVRSRSREIDWDVRGLSVTAPHKSAVMQHLDWIESDAKQIGAVNTIVVEGDALKGYNTDAAAFIAPLRRALGSLANVACAIIGAGGAARTAAWSLLREGAAVTLFVRAPEGAGQMAQEFGADCHQLQGASFRSFDVVVNATPLGTVGEHQDDTVAVAEQLAGVRLVYDLVYNPQETRLLREAQQAGCLTVGGLEMLLAQAAEQFELWTGKDAPVNVMREAATRALVSHGSF